MVNKCPYRRRQSEVNILGHPVVICFQISIFEPLKTARFIKSPAISCCDLLSN